MSVGYAFLLSNGATSPWHKTRDLVDEPRYRDVWDANTDLKVVAIIRASEKPCFSNVITFGYGPAVDEFPQAAS